MGMRRDNPLKHFAIAFAIAVAIYVTFYGWIEHRRARKGPWEMTFTTNSAGAPQILINQPKLALTNFTIRFPGESIPATISFKEPRQVPYPVPFGRCIFMDSTFLPGTLTFQFFGHEIELLPRVLIIDHREYPWTGEPVVSLARRHE